MTHALYIGTTGAAKDLYIKLPFWKTRYGKHALRAIYIGKEATKQRSTLLCHRRQHYNSEVSVHMHPAQDLLENMVEELP